MATVEIDLFGNVHRLKISFLQNVTRNCIQFGLKVKFVFASVNNLLDDWTFDQRQTQRQTVGVELTGRIEIRNCVGKAALNEP